MHFEFRLFLTRVLLLIGRHSPGRLVVSCLAAYLPAAISAFGQSYSPLYALNSPTVLYDYCYDDYGDVVANCYIGITAGYYPNTNYHTHDSPSAPLSTVTPSSGTTNDSGYLQVTLATTIVGHAEYLQSCTYYACTTYQYAVGAAGIYWNSDHGIWIQNGQTAIHGNTVTANHWMTSNAAYGYYDTTVAYQSVYPGQVYFERYVASVRWEVRFERGLDVAAHQSRLRYRRRYRQYPPGEREYVFELLRGVRRH